IRQHLAGHLQFAESQRPAAPLPADPAQIEADHLPERIEPEATGHDRIVLEMTTEEPEVRLDVELGTDEALAEMAAGLADFADARKHQTRGQRQLGVARPETPPGASSPQVSISKTAAPIQHIRTPLLRSAIKRF